MCGLMRKTMPSSGCTAHPPRNPPFSLSRLKSTNDTGRSTPYGSLTVWTRGPIFSSADTRHFPLNTSTKPSNPSLDFKRPATFVEKNHRQLHRGNGPVLLLRQKHRLDVDSVRHAIGRVNRICCAV